MRARQSHAPPPPPAPRSQRDLTALADSPPSGAELTRELLLRQRADPAFNATWGAYWAALPAANDTLCADMFTPEQVDLLQHATLVRAPLPARPPLAAGCCCCCCWLLAAGCWCWLPVLHC